MHRLFAPSAAAARLVPQQAGGVATSAAHHAAAVVFVPKRCMSAGSKRDNKNGIPVRRAGGIRLPDDEHVLDASGRERYKSRKQTDREDRQAERNEGVPGEWQANEADAEAKAGAESEGMSDHDFVHGSKLDHEMLAEFKRLEREPLREGEQSWRERALAKAGIKQKAAYRVQRAEELAGRFTTAHSSASKHNPVLIRTREHLNSSDLPPAFDHFRVPPLSAEEVDRKQRELHASYWNKYAAWKEARPEEHAQWLKRLEKREREQDYHWQQSQLNSKKRISLIAKQNTASFLPLKHRESFAAAVKEDASLAAAVEKLGTEEVLRRWSAYHVFLDAEMSAETRARNEERVVMQRKNRDKALNAEDPIATINDPNLHLTVPQKKSLYKMMLGAKRREAEAPFWTDPDPRFEGEHDWKMADAFVKPPLLPPLHLLREYSARPEVNSNFSSLHRFLHMERLRQTVHFLREAKKKVTRVNKRAHFEIIPYAESLIAQTEQWPRILAEYPFLSDAFLTGAANMHRSPWAQADQKDFIKALHKNVVAVAGMLDIHFNRRNRNAAWILPFPNNSRANPDDVLRPMTTSQVKRMEAELLAGKMMAMLEEQQGGPKLQAAPIAKETPKETAATKE